ncbi:MAG: hypothetical protein ACI38B_02350, partial [Bifidobacterium sp.]
MKRLPHGDGSSAQSARPDRSAQSAQSAQSARGTAAMVGKAAESGPDDPSNTVEYPTSAPIRGVNLGNWLVLEKWMEPALFEGYRAEDEDTLATVAPKDQLTQRIRHHRDTYITERDFREIATCGM